MRSHRQAIEKQVNLTNGILKELKAARLKLTKAKAAHRKAKTLAGMEMAFKTAKTDKGQKMPLGNAEERKAYIEYKTEAEEIAMDSAKTDVDILQEAYEFNRSVLSAIKSASDEESFEMEWADA